MIGDATINHKDDPQWIRDNYVVHYGITDEVAWADLDVSGVSYRNGDNIEIPGYRYLVPGDPAFDSIGGGVDTVGPCGHHS